jgi:hypothetical protein
MGVLGNPQRLEATGLCLAGEVVDAHGVISGKDANTKVHGQSP